MNYIKQNKANIISCLSIFILVMFASCEQPTQLIDYYYIYPQDEFGYGYHLICKLGGGPDDPFIEYIQGVRWNNKYIILEQKKPEEVALWYVIKAQKEELACCYEDTIFGPLSNVEMEELIKNEDIGKLKVKRF